MVEDAVQAHLAVDALEDASDGGLF